MSNNFDSLFGNQEVPFKCPKCDKTLKVKLNEFNNNIECNYCHSTITLKVDSSFDTSKQNTDNELNELRKTIKNFGK